MDTEFFPYKRQCLQGLGYLPLLCGGGKHKAVDNQIGAVDPVAFGDGNDPFRNGQTLFGKKRYPFSSMVRHRTTPPYFFTIGKTASMTSLLPLTELISGLPL
jgi:hypothetical protein